eukprot:EG_transcript_27506
MPKPIELAPRHFCLDQADPDVQLISKNIPWYGPQYSPHPVPAFYDISGITENPVAFRKVIQFFVERYRDAADGGPTHVAGFDARGFIFGPPVALELGIPFVMLRKSAKTPGVLVSAGSYITEYSTSELMLRIGAVRPGDRVLLVDDLLATGGTALAGFDLVDALGAKVYEFAAMVALPGLDGVAKIHTHRDGRYKDVPIFTMIDDTTIGPDMCRDPPAGTPRCVPVADAQEW